MSVGRAPDVTDLTRNDLLEAVRNHSIMGQVTEANLVMAIMIERALLRIANALEAANEL